MTMHPDQTGFAPLLSVEGVTLQYKTPDSLVTATYRVDFKVYDSDRFVLLGPSADTSRRPRARSASRTMR